MPEQALYLKWRPLAFDAMVGQEHITRALRNALKSSRVRHAYLLSGPRGTGKTTTARLLAKAVNCLDPDPEKRPCNTCAACLAINEGRFLDLIEIDAATHTGVDDVRDLREKIAFAPGEGRFKVYIIDEVHRFSGSAFDALLKTLEEPPEHAIFVLATTEIDKVPATIKSRCLQFEFRRFSVREVADRLQAIVEAEGLRAEREALEMIARQGTGSMRDSISLLDQIIADPNEVISVALVERLLGTASSEAVHALTNALIAGDAAAGLRVIGAAIDSGTDPRQFSLQIIEHLRRVLLAQTAGPALIDASHDERERYAEQAALIERGLLLRALRAFNEASTNTRTGWQPQLALELALVESLQPPPTPELSAPATAAAASPAPPARAAGHPQPEQAQAEPNKPPVIPLTTLRERWETVLRALQRYSSTSRGVMDYFRVLRIDGNVVTLGTDQDFYYKRIAAAEDKKRLIERAFYDVFRVPVRVQVALVSDLGANEREETALGIDRDDPLISTGIEFGAEVRRLNEEGSTRE
ncbi:MAG: DNA polymerase III subunit gamma/tau [Aggregatilineales bacterium]